MKKIVVPFIIGALTTGSFALVNDYFLEKYKEEYPILSYLKYGGYFLAIMVAVAVSSFILKTTWGSKGE